MKLITFSGLDGSGKTTQIKLFQAWLKEKNLKVKTIHIIQNSIANRFRSKKKRNKGEKSPERPVDQDKSEKPCPKEPSLTQNCVWRVLLRKFALVIDIILLRSWLRSKALLNLIIKRKKVDVLIFDRYFYDYLINIYYLQNKKEPQVPPLLKFLIPKPDLAFYLRVKPEEAQTRKQDQGLDYLKRKERLFKELAPKFELIELDNSLNKEATAQKIQQSFSNLNK